jgi:hypothetical protein
VRRVLGRVEALEGEPPPPRLHRTDAERLERLGVEDRHGAVGQARERAAIPQGAIERHAQRSREVVVTRARRA